VSPIAGADPAAFMADVVAGCSASSRSRVSIDPLVVSLTLTPMMAAACR
jgi:hypothetical protein